MHRSRVSAFVSAALGLTALTGFNIASAQSPAAAAQPAPAAGQAENAPGADTGGALQEVVVTAERRSEDIQTTPISIQVMNQDQLAQQDITHIKNLQLYTPSVSILDDGLYQAPSIRGIGNSAIIPNVTTGVAVLVDNLFTPEPHGLDEPFYDIQDVETLRGPQGTFVGYSSTGGAIQITSNSPNFRGDNGYLELGVGNYTDKHVDGAANYVLSDTFAVRLAFNFEQMGSFYRDVGAQVIPGEALPIQDPGSTDNKDMRLSFEWKPNSKFTAMAKFDYNSSNDGGDVSQINQATFTVPAGTNCPANSGPSAPGPNGGLTCHATNYLYGSHNPWTLNWGPQAYLLPQLGHPYYNYRIGLHLDYALDNGIDFRSVTGFQQSQYDTYGNSNSYPQTVTYATPTGCSVTAGGVPCTGSFSQTFNSEGAAYQWIPKDDYYSEELDVISPTTGDFYSKLNWIVGGTWFYRDTGVAGYSVSTLPPYSFERPQVSGSNTENLNRIAGVFGQISWQMTQTLQWQIGLRQNWDNNPTRGTVSVTAIPNLSTTTPNVGCAVNLPYQTGSAFLPSQFGYTCNTPLYQRTGFTDSVTTGKADLNWTPWQGEFFYAFFARGYKAGGAQLGAPSFDPEHVNDFEIGWNGTYGNWLTTHLGGYYMKYQDMQQSVSTVQSLTGGAIVQNIGSSTLEGIEAQMNARVGGLGINFNGSYEHSALGSINGIVRSYELPPGSGAGHGQCGLPGVTASTCFNYVPYAANLEGEPDLFAPEFEGTLGLDYRFNVWGGVLIPQVNFSYTAKQYASLFELPYYELQPRHIWNANINYNVNQWNAEIFMNNFTDQTYLTGAGNTVFYGAPMQLGVRVRRDF